MTEKQLILKILTYCSLVIATAVVFATFITCTNYTQLVVAMLLYPALVYFIFRAFPRKTNSDSSKEPVAAATIETPLESTEKVEVIKKDNSMGIADIDKRMFLSLIGGAGITLFLLSIFNKRAENLFFKSAPASSGSVSLEDIAGKKIDPAQNQPLDGYRISEIDDNVVTFYGFTNKDGAWFVMKEDSDTGSFRYARGDSNFPANWTNRENLKYDYFSNIF